MIGQCDARPTEKQLNRIPAAPGPADIPQSLHGLPPKRHPQSGEPRLGHREPRHAIYATGDIRYLSTAARLEFNRDLHKRLRHRCLAIIATLRAPQGAHRNREGE